MDTRGRAWEWIWLLRCRSGCCGRARPMAFTGCWIRRSAGSGAAKTVDSLLPQSLTRDSDLDCGFDYGGVCEELAFRGFLQRQFHALSGNVAVAVWRREWSSGLFHAYQGWSNVCVISVLGVLYGVLAAWRRNLRATYHCSRVGRYLGGLAADAGLVWR